MTNLALKTEIYTGASKTTTEDGFLIFALLRAHTGYYNKIKTFLCLMDAHHQKCYLILLKNETEKVLFLNIRYIKLTVNVLSVVYIMFT